MILDERCERVLLLAPIGTHVRSRSCRAYVISSRKLDTGTVEMCLGKRRELKEESTSGYEMIVITWKRILPSLSLSCVSIERAILLACG